MGKCNTPKYVIVIDGQDHNSMEWKTAQYGAANKINLEKYLVKYVRSFSIGQCNDHVSKRLGYIPYPNKAEIKRNVSNGETVVEWKAPMFFSWDI